MKTIVVSGCSRGIGRAVCDEFAAAGFKVAGFARNSDSIAAMQRTYEEDWPSGRFLFRSVDATQPEQIKAFAQEVIQAFGTIDVLVNNAGTYKTGSIMNDAEGELESMMDLNFLSAYHLTRALKGHIGRNIFNLSSIAGLQAYAGGATYTISKFAMLGFSRQLRLETLHQGIKVTTILPGAVRTDSWNGTDLPDSRFIRAEDIAKTISGIYNLSDSAVVEEIIIRPQEGDI